LAVKETLWILNDNHNTAFSISKEEILLFLAMQY
jgi:hypothetical protein